MTDYTYLSFSQIKKSTVIRIMKSIPLTKNIAVLSDKMIYIAHPLQRSYIHYIHCEFFHNGYKLNIL